MGLSDCTFVRITYERAVSNEYGSYETDEYMGFSRIRTA